MDNTITFEDFDKVDIRVGKIIEVEDFERARFPTYKLTVDFGPEIGTKHSSARFKSDYTPQQLIDKLCIAVVNFPPKNIAGFTSEVLVLGVPKPGGGISIVRPLDDVPLGVRVY